MNAPIKHQIIEGPNGQPLFAVIPYDEYTALVDRQDSETTLPHAVVGAHVIDGKSLVRAWREHRGLTQNEVAEKMGVTQAAYCQMEKQGVRLRRPTIEKIAEALGVEVEQLGE
jgi:DNA-binding XRE family transcriptional regulator